MMERIVATRLGIQDEIGNRLLEIEKNQRDAQPAKLQSRLGPNGMQS